jgi:hypothetical protein
MTVKTGERVLVPQPTRILISPSALEACGVELAAMTGGGIIVANLGNFTANSAIFYPFGIAEQIVVQKMWWLNGAAVTGNIDIGIYTAAGARVISIGPTAQATINVIQEVDVTDTVLVPGRYYVGIAGDTGTNQRFSGFALTSVHYLRAVGVLQVDGLTSGTLPTSVTFATATINQLPFCGLSGRSLVV